MTSELTEYKKSADIPIGGILVRKNGKKYIAVAEPIDQGCGTCALNDEGYAFCRPIRCVETERKDKQGIIFVRRKDLETIL